MSVTVTTPTAGALPIIGAVVAVDLDGNPISIAGALRIMGSTDCSGNPNYPAATAIGQMYYVSVAGKIGGASGKVVEVGDAYVAKAVNAGGTEAAVGTSWFVIQANISGITAAGLAMITAANAAAQTALLSNVVGDSGSGGTKGLVPAPAAGDAVALKFLKADGTWVAPSGGAWGAITGTISAQTDLQNALDAKAADGDVSSSGITTTANSLVGCGASPGQVGPITLGPGLAIDGAILGVPLDAVYVANSDAGDPTASVGTLPDCSSMDVAVPGFSTYMIALDKKFKALQTTLMARKFPSGGA